MQKRGARGCRSQPISRGRVRSISRMAGATGGLWPFSCHGDARWRDRGSQATWRWTGCLSPWHESPTESDTAVTQPLGSSPRTDRLTNNVSTTVLKAGPLRHVPPLCLEALGPSRAEVPQKVEKGLLCCVVTVMGTRPQGHGLQSSEAPVPPPPTGLAGAGRQKASAGFLSSSSSPSSSSSVLFTSSPE